MRSRSLSAACALGVLASPLAIVPVSSAATTPAGQALSVPVSTPARADSVAGLADLRGPALRASLDRHVTVARRHARLAGDRLNRGERGDLRRRLTPLAPETIARRTRTVRRKLNRLEARLEREREREAAIAVPGHLQAIASCESGGDPAAVDPSGTYRGKYQFDLQTWASVGGSGDPASAPEAEQDKRAAMLYERSGATPWPVCGQ